MAYSAPLPSLNGQKRERCYNLDYSNLEFADLNTGLRRIGRHSTKWVKAPDSITYTFDDNARLYVKLAGTGCGCNKLTFSCWFLAGLTLPHCIKNSKKLTLPPISPLTYFRTECKKNKINLSMTEDISSQPMQLRGSRIHKCIWRFDRITWLIQESLFWSALLHATKCLKDQLLGEQPRSSPFWLLSLHLLPKQQCLATCSFSSPKHPYLQCSLPTSKVVLQTDSEIYYKHL